MPERSLNTERFIATLMVMATLWSGCESALDEVDSAPPEAETSEVLGDTYTEGLEKRGDAELIRVARRGVSIDSGCENLSAGIQKHRLVWNAIKCRTPPADLYRCRGEACQTDSL